MTPILAEHPLVPKSVMPALNLQMDIVGPKEAFIGGPQVYNKIAEEKGTKTQPPATHTHYLPIWDPDTKYVVHYPQ